MIKKDSKTAIIGAGASGLTAAIALARRGVKVTLYEHKDKAGLKLSITGNGKCNFTNAVMNAGCYHAYDKQNDNDCVNDYKRITYYLNRFTTDDAVNFLKSIGINSIEKNGYFYPVTEKASDVVTALVSECKRLGVELIYNCGILDVNGLKDTYDNLVFACGSFAHKETGSNGSGFKYLEALGIKYTRVLPALCAVYCDDDTWCRKNDGKRIIATVNALIDGKKTANDTGEVQVTSYGYSGIPVFQISRYISRALDNKKSAEIEMDFNPSPESVPEILRDRYKTETLNSGETPSFTSQQSSRKSLKSRVSKVANFTKAQVCTGGVPLNALSDGFEVISHPGIYVIGEMCDVDGICGGYNLHWAWLSGNLCGL